MIVFSSLHAIRFFLSQNILFLKFYNNNTLLSAFLAKYAKSLSRICLLIYNFVYEYIETHEKSMRFDTVLIRVFIDHADRRLIFI